ncbi:MAG: hypothetical protein QOD39_1877 [Mycobacterium sp.]|jgi:hypothetical protein|nr:hypothetical protein [Mycobacterium sp.]
MTGVRVSPSLRRWLWFAALYAAGVFTVAVLAYGLRALLKLFG